MNFWLLVVAVVTLILRLYWWVKRKLLYFEERGVHYIKPKYLIGTNLGVLLGKVPMGELYTDLYRSLEGKRLVGFFTFLKPRYLVRDPELVHRVLVKDFSSFHSHGFNVDEKTNPLEGNLFNLDGEKWHALRKKLSPTFTSGKLKWMFQQMNICGDSLMTALNQELSFSQEIEVRDLMARFTTDVIGSCAFGFEPVAIKDKDCPFRVMGRRIFTTSAKDMLVFAVRMAYPRLFNALKLKTIPKETNDFFFSLISQSFEHRLKTGEKRNDFVQLLLELKEKGSIDYDPGDVLEEYEVGDLSDTGKESDKLELTDEVLTAQAFVFFAAGFETSATSISFTLYKLAKHPECQEKLREEIKRVKETREGRLDYDALRSMTYLEACISETMRQIPPFQVLTRVCTRDTFLDGVLVEKGTMLLLPMVAIQNDPEYFDSPDEFRPERFIEGTPRPGSFAPFGDGPRICIARRFALVEAKLAVARILESFRLTLSPRMSGPLKMAPRSFITVPEGGLWLRFEPIPP